MLCIVYPIFGSVECSRKCISWEGITLKWKYATALGYNTYRIVYSLLFKPLPYFLKVDKPVKWWCQGYSTVVSFFIRCHALRPKSAIKSCWWCDIIWKTVKYEVNVTVTHISHEHYHTEDQSWSHWLLWNLKPVWFWWNWEKSGFYLVKSCHAI